jgi:dihydroneopterin aldolase
MNARSDHIFIRDLRIDTLIGFHKHERLVPQTVSFDIEIGIANDAVFSSDRVSDCIDYDKVAGRIAELAAAQHYKLVETLADRVARAILAEFAASRVRVSIAKLGVMKNASRVGVSVERSRA